MSSLLPTFRLRRTALATLCIGSAFCSSLLPASETIDDALAKAALIYAQRQQAAMTLLSQTRARIDGEKIPLLKEMRAAENRIIAADTETSRMVVSEEDFQNNRRRLLKDFETLRKNFNYFDTLAGDSLKALKDGGLPPGESEERALALAAIQRKMENAPSAPSGQAGVEVAQFLLEQIKSKLGGDSVSGKCLIGDSRAVRDGSFVFLGPETYFIAKGNVEAGTVRMREGANIPMAYPLQGWKADHAQALLDGKLSFIAADASSGKALKLMETTGTMWDHIKKGGVVAFAILGVGLVAVLMMLQKFRDLSLMSVDGQDKVRGFMERLLRDGPEEARKALSSLGPTTRELFVRGLQSVNEPKELLEEHLYAVLLRQRLHFERRLPLLAVIATAAPLMGLLGTVMGMVKTFALITVFGTGNAGKLASGISEVLVATELGLMVAIPTLVAHGFLSHRIQKNLALLERYALEFVSAAQGRAGLQGKPPVEVK